MSDPTLNDRGSNEYNEMSNLIKRLRRWNMAESGGDTTQSVMRDLNEAADEIERLREELNVTRLQRDAKLSSQTAVDEAAKREIERLKKEVGDEHPD